MMLQMPESVFKLWEDEYYSGSWETMPLNSSTAGSNAWKMGHKDPQARGPWVDVYTNDEEAAKLTQATVLQQFRQKIPDPKNASVADCQTARPKEEALDALSLRARVFVNCVRAWVLQEFGPGGVQKAEDLFKDGSIDCELDDLSTARSKVDLIKSLNLHSLPMLRRLLEGKTARIGDAELVASTSADFLAKFGAYKTGVEAEAAEFELKIKRIQGERQGDCVRALVAAQAAREEGDKLIEEEFFQNGLKILPAEDLKAATVRLQNFVVGVSAGAAPKAPIPKLSLWCMNVGGNQMCVKKSTVWQPLVDAISSAMGAFPESHLTVYLEKTQGSSCEELNHEVFKRLKEKGMDATRTLSIHHALHHKSYKGTANSPGRIVVVDAGSADSDSDHLLSESKILTGQLTGLPIYEGVICYYVDPI